MVAQLTIHGTTDFPVLPIMQLDTAVIKAMAVTVHPIHLGQYPIRRLSCGREGKVADDLWAGWNEFLLDVSPGFGHLRFDLGGHRRQSQQHQQGPL